MYNLGGDGYRFAQPILLTAMLRKKAERKKLAIAQTVFRSDRFFLPLLGANQRGPIEQIFDRFAMRATSLTQS